MEKPAVILAEVIKTTDVILAESALNSQQTIFIQHIRDTASSLHRIAAEIPPTDYAISRVIPALGDIFAAPQPVIAGYARMLMEHPETFGGAVLSEWQREHVAVIYEKGLSLLQLTERLNEDLFEERKQQRSAPAASFDLNMLIWQQVPVYRYWIRHENVRLTVRFPSGLPPIHCNPYHIGEIVQHLVLTIARELIESGQIELSASLAEDQTALVLHIFWSGIQLQQENLTTLFQQDGRHVYHDQLVKEGIRLSTSKNLTGSTLLLYLPLAPRIT